MKNLNIQKTKNNSAWVFPGQSSQKLGMGLDLLAYPFARAKLKQAEQILGWSIIETCQSADKLSSTLYTQPCLYVVETLLAELMKMQGYKPDLVAGYSLGEYAAIYAAGAFDFETGLHLIKSRGEIMNDSPKGRMVALIGFNQNHLEEQILHTPNVWQMNDDVNLAIISGTFRGVQSLLDKIQVKRSIPLSVSCPFHTPLMAGAAAEFQEILESVDFAPLRTPMVSSTDLIPTLDIGRLKDSLIQQIYQPVKWRAMSLLIVNKGIKEVVEVGPGNDLIKQMKRTCPELAYSNIGNLSKIKKKEPPLEIIQPNLHFA